ncbi:MAG: Nif3-like dinuclear metal center hexameric protein [Bacteroidales bacterium]|jgi:dinuclear metal center YbgI/SA1388 family protein|nr:Nif3-like dinuclear metal center hexameric protein [Bacteroidales bacterium]
MKIKARDLVAPLERIAPPDNQEEWDNCGFSAGDPDGEVEHALLALDCTEAVMDEAVENGCDIIITHHPLIFGGIKSVTPETVAGRIIIKAVKNGVTVYSLHTCLDKADPGINTLMTDKIGLRNVSELSECGIGRVGDLQEPLAPQDFVKYVKDLYGLPHVRCSALTSCRVRRVAVCGGNGRSLISDAVASGAQAYVTGDLGYHDYYCDKDFMVIDIGHYASEFGAVELFSKIICENFPKFAVSKSKRNNNPINIY